MRVPEVVTVSAARSGLSRMLSDLSEAGPEAEPVLIGAHRKAQAVLLSVEAYERLVDTSERRAAAASVAGSLSAEGLTPSSAAQADTQAYVNGDISGDELVARALARYKAAPTSRLAG